MKKKFGHDLSLEEVKNTQKMTSLPLFWHTGSSLGRMKIWRGKWAPNSEIPLGLEIRQAKISNKHTWAQFGFLQVPQNRLQSGATHIESGAAHIGKKALNAYVSRNFASRLFISGPSHMHFIFSAHKVVLKVFSLQMGSYPSGKGRKRATQAICHVCGTAPVADVWLSTFIL